jgi:hypothetical protein
LVELITKVLAQSRKAVPNGLRMHVQLRCRGRHVALPAEPGEQRRLEAGPRRRREPFERNEHARRQLANERRVGV